MYPQMVYHADVRAREKAQAAREREMGCSSCAPLGMMMSRFIRKSNGRREGRVRYDKRMGMDYAMAYAPAQTCYVRPTAARTVTLAATTTSHHPANAHADHPDRPHPPPRATTTTLPPGTPSIAPAGAPAQHKPKKKKKKKHVRFTPSGGAPVPAGAGAAPPPHDAAMVASGGSAPGSAYHHGPPADPSSYSPAPPAHGGGYGGHHGYAYGYGRYAPSPLPRWEMLGTPRRPEYFSSEYRWYYPTPVREGIYSIATDANGRLTTIFSEENPNACTIV